MGGHKRTNKQKKNANKKKNHAKTAPVAEVENAGTVASVNEEPSEDGDSACAMTVAKKRVNMTEVSKTRASDNIDAIIANASEHVIAVSQKPTVLDMAQIYTLNSFKIAEIVTRNLRIAKGAKGVPELKAPFIETRCSLRTVTGMTGHPRWGKFPGPICQAFLIIEPTNDVLMLRPHDVFKRMEVLGNVIERMVHELKDPGDKGDDSYLRNMCILKCEGMWLRAACSEVRTDRIYCYLLDGGFFTWAAFANMLPMTQKMIDLLPFLALECELGGIKRKVAFTDIRHVIYQFLSCDNGMCYAVQESDKLVGSMGGPTYNINLMNKYGKSLNHFLLRGRYATVVPGYERFLRDAFIVNHKSLDRCRNRRIDASFVRVVDRIMIGTSTEPIIMLDRSTTTSGINTADASTAMEKVATHEVSTATRRVMTVDADTCTDPIITADVATTTDEISISNIVVTCTSGTGMTPTAIREVETSTDFEGEYDIYKEVVKIVDTAEAGSSPVITFADVGIDCDLGDGSAEFNGTAVTYNTISTGTDRLLTARAAAMTCI